MNDTIADTPAQVQVNQAPQASAAGPNIPRRPGRPSNAERAANALAASAPSPSGISEEERADIARRRANRQQYGAQRMKLAAPSRPGFVRRWVNDTPGNMEARREQGYSFVNDASGQPITKTVGVATQGGGLNACLMEIPEEFYREDQALKDAPLKQFDADLRRGAVNGTPGVDGRYVPHNADGTSRIKVETR